MPNTTGQAANRPELTIGPFPGGISINVWLNDVQTPDGPSKLRSVTLAPRSYRDEHGQWKNSSSYRPIDLPAIILALQKAYDYCTTTPIPGVPASPTPPPELEAPPADGF